MLEYTGILCGLIRVYQREIALPSPALAELTVLAAVSIEQSKSRSKIQVEKGRSGVQCTGNPHGGHRRCSCPPDWHCWYLWEGPIDGHGCTGQTPHTGMLETNVVGDRGAGRFLRHK